MSNAKSFIIQLFGMQRNVGRAPHLRIIKYRPNDDASAEQDQWTTTTWSKYENKKRMEILHSVANWSINGLGCAPAMNTYI